MALPDWMSLRRREPILPEAGAGGPPLTAVIAVISFLATLSLAGYLLITDAARTWTTELRSALTIQIPGDTAQAIEDRTAMAVRVLSTTDGVIDYKVMSPEAAAGLVKPWLGNAEIGSYFNVPAVIEVSAEPRLQQDLNLLRSRMTAAAPGAIVNDHGNWKGRLEASVRSVQFLAFSVFLLVMGAACAVAIFAARAGLAANHEVVAILHLVGATDEFIAAQVQQRFFLLGLRGAIAGLALAVIILFLISMVSQGGGVDLAFVPSFSLTMGIILTLMVVPVVTCLVTAFTARMTVLRTLAQSF